MLMLILSLIIMMLWKKENFKVKYYFYDQSYQFSEVLFLMCMLHFPKRSSGTPGDNNNNNNNLKHG